MKRALPLSLIGLAVLYTLLNVVKPLVIDDAAYWAYADQIARHPLDPYGFAMFWYDIPYPANYVLAPPALPYWWASSIALFGQNPYLWKLGLFPIALLLVWALYDLFRRFASGWEVALTWLTVLSPAFLPSFNFMLDVPALALSLASVALFLRALDKDNLPLAALAGLVAGVGMETKYTAALAPVVMLFAALLQRRPLLWVAAALVAAQVFVTWELVTALLYGDSHFLFALRDSGGSLSEKLWQKVILLPPLVIQLGGIGPAVFLIGLAGLGLKWRGLAVAGLVVALGYAAVALVPRSFDENGTPEVYIFCAFGLIGGAIVFLVLMKSTLTADKSSPWPWLLLLWLAVEVAAYFPLTPFPAVRRTFGVFLVLTLLTGSLAARRWPALSGRPVKVVLVAVSALLGFVLYATDMVEAWTTKIAAEQGAELARSQTSGDVWFVGHWGFQFYGEAAGMKPIVVRGSLGTLYVSLPSPSRLHKGDVLVVPDGRLVQQTVYLDPNKLEPLLTVDLADGVPLRTVIYFYGGTVPFRRHGDATRLQVTLYKVLEDCSLDRDPPSP